MPSHDYIITHMAATLRFQQKPSPASSYIESHDKCTLQHRAGCASYYQYSVSLYSLLVELHPVSSPTRGIPTLFFVVADTAHTKPTTASEILFLIALQKNCTHTGDQASILSPSKTEELRKMMYAQSSSPTRRPTIPRFRTWLNPGTD